MFLLWINVMIIIAISSCIQGRSYSQDGPPTGQVYYAEIDVLAKSKNQIPEVEDASPHVYAVLEQLQSHDIVHHDQIDEVHYSIVKCVEPLNDHMMLHDYYVCRILQVVKTEQNDAYNKDHNHPD